MGVLTLVTFGVMPLPLSARRIGWRMGPKDADVELGAFLDFMCPFSRKAYRTLRNEVFPHYMRKEQAVKPSGRSLSFSFYQHVQPWHPQGILLHNAPWPWARWAVTTISLCSRTSCSSMLKRCDCSVEGGCRRDTRAHTPRSDCSPIAS